MIQRIQSLYLFLTAFLSGLFLSGGIFKSVNNQVNDIIMNFTGIYQTSGDLAMVQIEKIIPFTVISILIPVISFTTIFMFKNRKLQIKLAIILLFLEMLLVVCGMYYYFAVIKIIAENIIPGIRSMIPLITIILTFLATRGIRRDNNLVRSYERLR